MAKRLDARDRNGTKSVLANMQFRPRPALATCAQRWLKR